jgi:ATP-binding cassette subfamily F protein 3
MLSFRDIRLRRGPEPLVEEVTLSIFAGEKVGIVGRNGCGKSTLLALVRGEIGADAGDYGCPAGLAIAHVAQELPHSQQPVVEHVIDGDEELRRIEAALLAAQQAHDGLREANLHAEYDRVGGYAARTRAASLLDGLGFDAADIDRPIREFSGGLRMRANLARALMCRSDVLLLDEPTNHLDLDAVLWLENWLRAYAGTLLLVSHDREFLDAVVGRILHIRDRRVTSYAGNYSYFEVEAASRAAQRAAANEKVRREAAHVRSFVERFRAKASKARQAQSRLKWLARLPSIIELRDEESYEWDFAAPRKLPRPLVAIEGLAAGYADRRVIDGVSLSIAPEARIGILGRNGAGKSTLMRSIAGELAPLAGTRVASSDLESGFFAQLEVDQLDPAGTALLELQRRGGHGVAAWAPQQQRDHLGQFGFRGDRVFEPVSRFSGGERARLSLAILVARRPNLLLLDEPTNHLDFDMRDSLLVALQDFAGAVVIVSHDRALLRGVCDEFLLVADGRVSPFDGDLEDYASWLAKPRAAPAGTVAQVPAGSSAAARKETRRQEAEARRQLAPLRAELQRLEAQIEQRTRRRGVLEQQLGDGEFYARSTAQEQRAASSEHAALQAEIGALETRWLELGEELERAKEKGGS